MLENPILPTVAGLKKNKSVCNIFTIKQKKVQQKSRCKSTTNEKNKIVCDRINKRDSPELENNKSFNFSGRNFYPRKNHFNTTIEKRKFNPFDYFSNDYYPTKLSPRKNQISLEYYNLAESSSQEFLKKTNSSNTYNFKTLNFNKFEEEKTNFNFNDCSNYSSPNNTFAYKNDECSTKSTSPNSFELSFVKRHNSDHTNNSKHSSNNSLPTTFEENKEFIKKSHFVERQGDWICTRCKNLNFSFRIVCNRCKISKSESEVLYEGNHMQNIFNLIKYNELIHNQILLAQQGAFNINSPAYFPPKNAEMI